MECFGGDKVECVYKCVVEWSWVSGRYLGESWGGVHVRYRWVSSNWKHRNTGFARYRWPAGRLPKLSERRWVKLHLENNWYVIPMTRCSDVPCTVYQNSPGTVITRFSFPTERAEMLGECEKLALKWTWIMYSPAQAMPEYYSYTVMIFDFVLTSPFKLWSVWRKVSSQLSSSQAENYSRNSPRPRCWSRRQSSHMVTECTSVIALWKVYLAPSGSV